MPRKHNYLRGPKRKYLNRCYWCKRNIVAHQIGGDVKVWVHWETNNIWCKPDTPDMTAWPRRSKAVVPEPSWSLGAA